MFKQAQITLKLVLIKIVAPTLLLHCLVRSFQFYTALGSNFKLKIAYRIFWMLFEAQFVSHISL